MRQKLFDDVFPGSTSPPDMPDIPNLVLAYLNLTGTVISRGGLS